MRATPAPAPADDRRERLAGLLEATSPATRAREAEATVLPVLAPLAGLLPHGGLAKGTITEATDTSLLLALAAGPATADRCAFTAAVGLPDLGLAAAAGYGLDLRRLLVVDHPGEHAVEVITALAAACPVVLAAAPTGLPPRTLDRLAAHLRRTGTVLLTPGPWPGAQLRLQVTVGRWSGLGDGWGQLTGRRAKVSVTGRGSAVRARSAELWLPDSTGTVCVADAAAGARGEGESTAVAALG
ncbi:hypothetical protein ADK60_14005 [Streptomyces sp. XY431]|uniref:hypothetical protein n=1 Tax=Streptomyces sp. XY431 TaxID=1415562 RepID=UPI0006AE078C|nr:hypothetical protein [Streptomyces sp. XY431]KOV32365.1 hypothetical protein ADK60_14005 [Streptomyces sp. XY431]